MLYIFYIPIPIKVDSIWGSRYYYNRISIVSVLYKQNIVKLGFYFQNTMIFFFFFLSFYSLLKTYAASSTFLYLPLSSLFFILNSCPNLFKSFSILFIQRYLGRLLSFFQFIFLVKAFMITSLELQIWPALLLIK